MALELLFVHNILRRIKIQFVSIALLFTRLTSAFIGHYYWVPSTPVPSTTTGCPAKVGWPPVSSEGSQERRNSWPKHKGSQKSEQDKATLGIHRAYSKYEWDLIETTSLKLCVHQFGTFQRTINHRGASSGAPHRQTGFPWLGHHTPFTMISAMTHNWPLTNLVCQQQSILKWVANACSGALSAPATRLGQIRSPPFS